MANSSHHITVTWIAKDAIMVYVIGILVPVALTIASRLRRKYQYRRAVAFYATDAVENLT